MTDFTPENSLEEALLRASEGGEPGPFLAVLGAEQLYPPSNVSVPDEGERKLSAGSDLALPVFEHDGQRFVVGFTSLAQLEQGAPQPSER